MRNLNDFESESFALMLLAGAPITDACAYFFSNEDGTQPHEAFIIAAAEKWPDQPEVLAAIKKHMGGEEWHKLTDHSRLELAMTKHYNEMAYFLYTHNYSELKGTDRMKADTCRQSLESKLAGTAGKGDQLNQYYKDVLARGLLNASDPE